MPTYNAAAFVDDCINTIQAQSLAPKEVIFVDDCSRDSTVSCIKSRAQKTNFEVMSLDSPVNAGPSKARNRGMAVATGDWIAFLDVDDLWHPDHLASLCDTAIKTGADFVYSGLTVVDLGSSTELYRTDFSEKRRVPHDLYNDSFIMPSQVLFRRRLLESGVHFDERLRHAEDADFWITLCQDGIYTACSKRHTFIYRKHGNTPSQDSEKCAAANAFRLIKYIDFGHFPERTLRRWARKERLSAARLSWRTKPLRALKHLGCLASNHFLNFP